MCKENLPIVNVNKFALSINKATCFHPYWLNMLPKTNLNLHWQNDVRVKVVYSFFLSTNIVRIWKFKLIKLIELNTHNVWHEQDISQRAFRPNLPEDHTIACPQKTIRDSSKKITLSASKQLFPFSFSLV